MRVTTGIDIIEVNRIKEMIDNYGEIAINKIYTNDKRDSRYVRRNGTLW